MSTNTTRLGLIKPDFVDVVDISELNSNADDIDAAVGAAVVTSGTRPSSPWNGQIIHETDTDKTLVWDGVAWVETGSTIDDLNDIGDVTITTPSAGEKLVFDGTNWVNLEGYVYVDTVYFTSSGTFTKATYPWLRAIRVKCQGGGGAGGGGVVTASTTVSPASGGGAGSYAESFITDIAGLPSSVTVTVGAGGLGVSGSNGNEGAPSSFDSLVIGTGAEGGGSRPAATTQNVFGAGGKTGSVGDLTRRGNFSDNRVLNNALTGQGTNGADSFFGAGGPGNWFNSGGSTGGLGPGAGGGGRASSGGTGPFPGSDGANGIVIVELYA